jgi:hypothetical protein
MYEFIGIRNHTKRRVTFYAGSLEEATVKATDWYGHTRFEFISYTGTFIGCTNPTDTDTTDPIS